MRNFSFSVFLLLLSMSPRFSAAEPPIVIAHRGASGYLPEHTIPAKAMAHALGADYLEQDVVLTRDDVPIVLHDIHLDRVTDVARQFPERRRKDGRFYAIDFTWEEIQTLSVTERLNDKGEPVFPGRFPIHQGTFRIPSLEEELSVIAGLNRSTGREAGIYPEIKQPAFHRTEGKDISRIVLSTLAEHGYTTRSARCFVQCFDEIETRRLRQELKTDLKLIQLLEGDVWKADRFEEQAVKNKLTEIAGYADGVGPALSHVLLRNSEGRTICSPLVSLAHELNLAVHPWTLRADEIPKTADSWDALHEILYQARVDGAFSDFPDQTLIRLNQHFLNSSKSRR